MSYSIEDHICDELNDYRNPADGAVTILQCLIDALDCGYAEDPDCEVISNELKSLVKTMEERDE